MYKLALLLWTTFWMLDSSITYDFLLIINYGRGQNLTLCIETKALFFIDSDSNFL